MIDDTATVDTSAQISDGVSIWHFAQVRENAVLGQNCVVGRGVYIGPGVVCGKNCKMQNYSLVYEPAEIGNGVFIGPAVVLTNDHRPRAVNPDFSLKRPTDWELVGVKLLDGASIGAGSVCVAPVVVGKWALVGAGSVVVHDVPDHAIVVGNPARQIGWVCQCGTKLVEKEIHWVCPSCDNVFLIEDGRLISNSFS